MRDLTQASHKLAESLYKATTAGAPAGGERAPGPEDAAGPQASPGKGEGDVIDAEVVDKK